MIENCFKVFWYFNCMPNMDDETMEDFLQRIQFNPTLVNYNYADCFSDSDSNSDSDYDSDYEISSDDSDSSSENSFEIDSGINKFTLVIPELFVSQRYGILDNIEANTHFISLVRLKYVPNNLDFFKKINRLSRFYRHCLWKEYTSNNKKWIIPGTPIRNWVNIMKRPEYYGLQLAQCITFQTGETVCIIKTFWLRIIQRTWKKVFKERKRILQNIYLRQIRGKINIPSLNGLLYGV